MYAVIVVLPGSSSNKICVCVCVWGGGGSATIKSGTYNIHDYALNRLCLEARVLGVPPKILVSS